MNYLAFHVTAPEELLEIILAELSVFPFESFEEKEGMVSAYGPQEKIDIDEVKQGLSRYQVSIETEIIPKENWNELWEKHYDPVFIDDQVIIRAEFHDPNPAFPYEIVITPKMSFGTGHHATTYLMLKQLLELNLRRRSVADFGSGTGVLAIMAHKLGASTLLATDVDDWCIENCRENFELNRVPDVDIRKGSLKGLSISKKFDVVLANINKNILLDEISEYDMCLKKGGKLLLSGFYQQDIADIVKKAETLGLLLAKQAIKNDWAVLVFEKSR